MHDFSYILTEVIFILLHFFVFLANYLIANKNLFYPSVLFSLSWTIVLSLHLIFGLSILNQLLPLRVDTFLILFIGNICFSLGSFIVTIYRQRLKNTTHLLPSTLYSSVRISLLLRLIFLGILIIGLPLYIQASYRVFIASQVDNFFVGLRTELSYGEEDIGITKYLVTFSFVTFAINYYSFLEQKKRTNRIIVIVSFILAVVYSIFATGRTYYFLILAIYLGINYLLNKKFSIKKYVIPFLLFIVFFVTIGIIYGKGGNKEDSLKDNLNASLETTAVYLVSSPNALDLEIQNHVVAKYNGENTLLFFVKIGQKLGLLSNVKAGTLLSEFVFVPYPTNVYTFYSPYIRDYGRVYAWLMIALFGGLHTWLFHKAVETKNLRDTLYYSFLLYPVLMSFFQDQYMSLFSTWLQIAFYTEVFIFINNSLLGKHESKL